MRRLGLSDDRSSIMSSDDAVIESHYGLRFERWKEWCAGSRNPFFEADRIADALEEVRERVAHSNAKWLSLAFGTGSNEVPALSQAELVKRQSSLGLWVQSRILDLRPTLEAAWRRANEGEPPELLTRDDYPSEFVSATALLHRLIELAKILREIARPFETNSPTQKVARSSETRSLATGTVTEQSALPAMERPRRTKAASDFEKGQLEKEV